MKTSKGATSLSRDSLWSAHNSHNQLTPVWEEVMKERVERVRWGFGGGGRRGEGSFYQLISLLSLNSKPLPWSMSIYPPLLQRELPSFFLLANVSSPPPLLTFDPHTYFAWERNICLLSRILRLLCPKPCLPSSHLVRCTPLYFYVSQASFHHSTYHFHVLFQSSASWSPSANQLWTFRNQSSCLICSCTMRA